MPKVVITPRAFSDLDEIKSYIAQDSEEAARKYVDKVLKMIEQAATALTRSFRRWAIPGSTFATDAQHPLNFAWPPLFADDANISYWARESVYFMAANGIILGTGENRFSPQAITPAQQAIGYATATREQALVIALRMAEYWG